MLWFLAYLLSSLALTLLGRLRGSPLRPTWSVKFEVIARSLKSNAARISRMDWQAQRQAWEAVVQPSPVLKQLRFEDAALGGVPGLWFIPQGVSETAGVILYFHGGSFIYASARTTHRELIAREALAAGHRVFAPEYRLAPEHQFPAAIDDAFAAYRALVDSGMSPSKIVIAGESAGGNLTLVTLLRARDSGVPLPAAAVLVSPFIDQTDHSGSMRVNARFDWAEISDFERWTETYLQGHDPRDPLASPALGDLRGLPPLLVQVGGAEMLLDQVTRFADQAKNAGVTVQFSVYPDMIHNWHTMASMFPEGQAAIDEIGAFVRRA